MKKMPILLGLGLVIVVSVVGLGVFHWTINRYYVPEGQMKEVLKAAGGVYGKADPLVLGLDKAVEDIGHTPAVPFGTNHGCLAPEDNMFFVEVYYQGRRLFVHETQLTKLSDRDVDVGWERD